MNPRGKDFEPKQEGDDVNNNDPNKYSNKTTAASTSTTSRQWSSFRNPRIVRVSRTFGGKDRHSKVCTVKGLRDRRIRLSVPTAIQLYDLQDRLGLSQPSKVVDWLLDATKEDIDQLPPLPIPGGNFTPFHQAIALSHQQQHQPHFFGATNPTSFMKDMGIKMMNDPQNGNDQTYFLERSKNWSSSGRKELVEEREAPVGSSSGKDKWIASNDEEDNQAFQCQNLFPIGGNQASFPPSLLPYNPFNYHWEPSNLSLSQIGSGSHSINHIPMQQTEEDSNNNNNSHHQHNSSSSIIHHHQQLHFCPSAATVLPTILPSLPIPSYMAAPSSVENDDPSRQINQFQFLTSSSSHHHQNSLMPTLHFIGSPMKSLTLNVINPRTNHHDSRENNDSHPNKGGTAGS